MDLIRTSPLWLILAIYLAAALTVAVAARSVMRSWLRRIAARSPSHFTEVLAASLPRPLAASVLLVEVDFGLRWLPVPLSLEAITKHLLPFLIGILVVLALARVGRKAIDAYGRSNPALRSAAGIGHAIIWVLSLSILALLASDALGISLAPALTALGVGSLAVALALQDTLSNFFSGLYLLIDKPVRPGEFIRLESGQEGYVESMGWRSTHLRTLVPSVIIVPNATLAKGVITNFKETNPRLSLAIRVDVAADADCDEVESALLEEAKALGQINGVRNEPAPFVRFLPGSGRRSLGFTLYVALEAGADAALVEHRVRKRLFSRVRRDRIAPTAATELTLLPPS